MPQTTAPDLDTSPDTCSTAHSRVMPRFTDPRSLRWKVALGVAIAACGMALGIGALVHQTTKDRSFSIGRSSAVQQLDAAKIAFRDERPPARAEAGGPYYAIGDAVPDQLVNLVNAAAGPVTWYDTRRPAQGPQMWAAERVNNTVVAVNVNMVVDKLSRQALDRHMMYAALATLAVVVPLTVLAAELMLRRLRRVAVTARQIKRGDLNVRTRTRGNDEISEISAAVNQMADALQERLHAEQRFTADVAHELRTPLTGLVTSASLLPESQATDLVRDRVQVLRALVDDLLEISRLDAGAEQADAREVPIGELLAESVRRTGLDTQLTVTGHPVVETDPRRLDRIVTNLVLNAHRHGGTPVEITVKDATIVVRDHGPGFPPEILAHGPQRFRTGAAERGHGHGLGLTIALGQTHVLGAHLTLTNTTPHGAVATLELPRHKE